ncbi:hypothetical protein CK203_081928 [Vitis vinifera]|uniref:DUF4283 domain-containing protein n=1 Tax=Vitis vinifera TaxID=29760 RepID=A0A438DXD9_VITVI|nr:hypothetical protein CK203_081928 [Vitis vinifera]
MRITTSQWLSQKFPSQVTRVVSWKREKDLERECVQVREMKAVPGCDRGLSEPFPVRGAKKRFSIFIPKGRGAKGGWILLAEALREMESRPGGQAGQEDKGKLWIPMWGKSFAEVVKQKCSTETSWNPRRGEGEDLRSWGTQMSKAWGLKGNLGLAKMNEGKVLLEFELVNEAEKALVDGEIEVEGLVMRLEKWSQRTGCLSEEEKEGEAWVRIVGLPISLWNRDILCKIGEGCGGFVDIDEKTERKEEIQWARIRTDDACDVDRREGKSIGADEEDEGGGAEGEVEGEVQPREGKRVRKVGGGSRLEEQLQKVDGTRKATHGSGRSTECSRGLGALQLRPKGKGIMQSGPTEMGFVGKMDSRRIKAWKPTVDIGLVEDGQRPMREPSGHLVEAQSRGPSSGSPIHECSMFWEKDELRRLREAEAFHKEQTKTDLALVEEAKRSVMRMKIRSNDHGSESPLRKNGECWDLVEVSKSSTDDVGKDVSSDQIVPRVSKAGEEISWENSDLAKFSNFLGFSTEGLEKDIMEFLVKIRKRRERVHRDQIETLSEGVVRSLGFGRWSNWTALYAMGTAGGILVCWDKEVSGGDGDEDRDCLWEELRAIRGLWEEPWCIGGDFNVILSQRERSRQGRLSGAMRNFAQTVDDLELIDLPMQGGHCHLEWGKE